MLVSYSTAIVFKVLEVKFSNNFVLFVYFSAEEILVLFEDVCTLRLKLSKWVFIPTLYGLYYWISKR